MMSDDDIEQYKVEETRVRELLRKLQEKIIPLKLDIDGIKGPRISSLLSLESEAGVMRFDEPPEGLTEMEKTDRDIKVHCEVDGVELSFTSRFTESPLEAGIPARIHYRQRRDDFRVHVGFGDAIKVRLPGAAGTPIEGTVRNLSAGGLGIELQFAAGQAPPWETGELMDDCVLYLDEGGPVHCSLKLCHLESLQPQRYYAGTQFIGLRPPDERRLRVKSMKMELEQQRRKPISDT